MTGIEKITARIQADAQQEIDAVLAEANRQAAEINARYAAQAKQAEAEILEKSRQSAAELRQRRNSSAQMDAKKQELAAKQALLDEAFQLAYEKLTQLPEGEYEDLLANLAVRASVSGKEQLIFSQADRAAFGGKVTAKANGLLVNLLMATAVCTKAGKTAELTLSPTTGDFQGGLLICDGDVEVNCTFETLVRMVRNEVVGDVTKALFA